MIELAHGVRGSTVYMYTTKYNVKSWTLHNPWVI